MQIHEPKPAVTNGMKCPGRNCPRIIYVMDPSPPLARGRGRTFREYRYRCDLCGTRVKIKVSHPD